MALHTKREFAAMCGLTTGNLTNYIKRGQVIASGDYIDDGIEGNRNFFLKRTKVSPNALLDGEVKEPEYNQDVPEVKEPESRLSKEEFIFLQQKKLLAEIAQKEAVTALNRVKLDKINGILMPTELVKIVFIQHNKSLLTELKNACENIVTLFAKKRDLSSQEIAEIRGEVIQALNEGMLKSAELSKKNINNIVAEYSETKEVGEHS
jgi:hypothetical protein